MVMQVLSFEKVTFAEDERREAEFWASKTIAERVKAGWDLRESNLVQRQAEHGCEESAAITFCRVERTWR